MLGGFAIGEGSRELPKRETVQWRVSLKSDPPDLVILPSFSGGNYSGSSPLPGLRCASIIYCWSPAISNSIFIRYRTIEILYKLSSCSIQAILWSLSYRTRGTYRCRFVSTYSSELLERPKHLGAQYTY